jgi:predicted GNAT superfamily acetyltransferase
LIEIRSCQGQEELEACVQLQVATWGYDPTDVVPRKAFLVAQKIGGQIAGAFDSQLGTGAEAMVGFLAAWTGVKTGAGEPRPYMHSHMLAVRPDYRNLGLGARMKWWQREEALSRGIRLMEWTFDPVEIKNAFLNIFKLGAIVRRYEVDFYGHSSSQLQGGLPTDRLVAEWWMDSERVAGFEQKRRPEDQIVTERITVPAEIYAWKATDRDRSRALEVLFENRSLFQSAFARGLAVLGFERNAEGNGSYLLGDPNQAATGLKL